jgi:hypothetical protein
MAHSHFIKFPELPKELQEDVWRYASTALPEADSRIHRIAPSPSFRYTRASADEVWFTIMPQQLTPVPSLLHVSKHSRDVALKVYQLWPCGEIDDKYQKKHIRAWIYVHKKHDIFYFGQREGGNTDASDYWFLHNLCTDKTQYGESTARSARAKFLELINGIEHWAFDGTIWDTRTARDYTWQSHVPIWYRTIFQAKTITIVLGNTPEQNTKLAFMPVTGGERRVKVAGKFQKELEYDADQIRKVCPQLVIPDFQVMVFTNSIEDDYEKNSLMWTLTEEALEAEFQEFIRSCDIKPHPGWEIHEESS